MSFAMAGCDTSLLSMLLSVCVPWIHGVQTCRHGCEALTVLQFQSQLFVVSEAATGCHVLASEKFARTICSRQAAV